MAEKKLSLSLLLHLVAQTQRTHIRPDFLDVSEALIFGALLAGILPAQGVFLVGLPDRILFLMIDHHFVNSRVLALAVHEASGLLIYTKLKRCGRAGPKKGATQAGAWVLGS